MYLELFRNYGRSMAGEGADQIFYSSLLLATTNVGKGKKEVET
jgi:hypothetical protein